MLLWYKPISYIMYTASLSLPRGGDLRVVRPLVFLREKELRQFAEKARLPVIAENCPACFEAPKVVNDTSWNKFIEWCT